MSPRTIHHLVHKLTMVDDKLIRYLNVARTTDTAANAHEVKGAKRRLKQYIEHAELTTLSDPETTVRFAERSREKIPLIGGRRAVGSGRIRG